MAQRRSLPLVFAALALAGCIAAPRQTPVPDGGYDPAQGNRFDGPLALDDFRVRDLDPATLPSVEGACSAPQLAIVTYVSDGDTVDGVLLDGTRITVRMIGVDTPEIEHGDGGPPAECYGNQATSLSELLRGRYVWLTFDQGCLDPFERTLAYVWVGSGPGDLWQRQLLRRGYARTLSIAPNTAMASTFEEDRASAEAADLGLWSACP